MKSFEGKVAAISGASSGMGRSLAVLLARRGCDVSLSDIDEAGLLETAALVRGVRVTTRRVDVSSLDDTRAWAEETVRDHGRVNLIFNNAGMTFGGTARSADLTDIERVIDVDFWGVVHGTRIFLPHLEASGEGHVINTSSLFGLLAYPGQSAYNAAKFAVRGFTECLRMELELSKSVVSATSVHPGGIQTNIVRRARMHPSLAELGVTQLDAVGRRFERQFRVTADEAAEVILRGVQRNARRVLIGTDARLLDLMQRVFPGSYHGIVTRVARRLMG